MRRLPFTVSSGLLAAVVLSVPMASRAQAWVEDCGLEPPGSRPLVPVPVKPWEPTLTSGAAPVVSRVIGSARLGGWPTANLTMRGALTGKTVYLSPGHGFTWTDTGGGAFAWQTQRGNTNAIVEDLVSIETLNQFLIPMLVSAGAHVVSVREADLNPNLVVVDNGEPGYVEQGTAAFANSSLPGWGRAPLPMDGATLPFTLGTNRLMPTAATATASATWTAQVPQSGYYNVYLSYTAFTARVTDAHFVVRHAGGQTHFRVNQQRHGGTWELLGRFYFRAGGVAQVVALNDSATVGGNVSLDAVRFGGGLGLTSRTGNAAGVSGRPRAEESARYHAQYAGAPLSVFAPTDNTPAGDRTNDVGTRSRFAAWVHEPGEDAVYVAWHTNAFNASAVGTNTYVYGPNPPDGTYTFTGVAGSDRLAQLVHAELVADIKASSGWNKPAWTDRGVDSAYFGELNPSNNGETPAILVEVAFHDAVADATQLKEPGFRFLAARAISQGIIKYFAEKDAVPVRLPPEAPTRVRAVNQGGGEAVVEWAPGETDTQGVRGQAAASYRLYASDDGLAWDDGVVVGGTSARVTIPADAPRFFRVTGVNDGGESMPSTVVGVRAPLPGRPFVLVVNGFDRLDAAMAPFETFASQYALGTVLRLPIWKMNDGSSTRLHGDALAANQVGFDSAEADAFAAGLVATAPYALVDWYAGRGKAGLVALSAAEQALLQAFRATNKPVFFSGNAAASVPWLSATVASGAGSRLVNGAGPLLGLSGLALEDGAGGGYDVGLPPGVDPSGGGVRLGSYDTGVGAAVGVAAQTVSFGFPFEGLAARADRVEVMRRVLAFLSPGVFDGGVVQVDAGAVVDAGMTADSGIEVTDAGVVDAGTDAGTDGGVEDAGLVSDAGASADAGTDGGIEPTKPVDLLAFQGGGCATSPALVEPVLTVLFLVFARRKRAR